MIKPLKALRNMEKAAQFAALTILLASCAVNAGDKMYVAPDKRFIIW